MRASTRTGGSTRARRPSAGAGRTSRRASPPRAAGSRSARASGEASIPLPFGFVTAAGPGAGIGRFCETVAIGALEADELLEHEPAHAALMRALRPRTSACRGGRARGSRSWRRSSSRGTSTATSRGSSRTRRGSCGRGGGRPQTSSSRTRRAPRIRLRPRGSLKSVGVQSSTTKERRRAVHPDTIEPFARDARATLPHRPRYACRRQGVA